MNQEIKPDASALEKNWRTIVARYQTPTIPKSTWQLINSLGPYILLWVAMWWSLSISYWLTLALVIPAAGFLVRVFIIFHDCGHGSFFKSNHLNDTWGIITGLLTFTPYYAWRHDHAVHHASAGNLDRRGVGDVMTMTVKEYQAASWWQKTVYSVFRFPPIMFTIGSAAVFLIGHRFPRRGMGKLERESVLWTNLAIMGMAAAISALIGFKSYLLIQLPIMILAASIGVWLFYVQHNFDGTYWVRRENWDFVKAALDGSSFYKLPKLFQWFTGNIGFHHIHHLSPRIPNYLLEKCHIENPVFQIDPLSFKRSLKSLFYRLWDEDRQAMVSFRTVRLDKHST